VGAAGRLVVSASVAACEASRILRGPLAHAERHPALTACPTRPPNWHYAASRPRAAKPDRPAPTR